MTSILHTTIKASGIVALALGFAYGGLDGSTNQAHACVVGSECGGDTTGGHESPSLPNIRFDRVVGAGIQVKFDVLQEGAALGLTDGVGDHQEGVAETYSRMRDYNRSSLTGAGGACDNDCDSFQFGVEFGVDNENGALAAHRATSGNGQTESFSAASTQQWGGFSGMFKFGTGGFQRND